MLAFTSGSFHSRCSGEVDILQKHCSCAEEDIRKMESLNFPVDFLSAACFMLLMLLSSNRALLELSDLNALQNNDDDDYVISQGPKRASNEADSSFQAALNHFRLSSTFAMMDEDLGFWVKPRSTTWFSRFLLHEYDDRHWIEMFRFSKRSVFNLASLIAPAIRKQDTNYRLSVPVPVRLACTLFKLSHGASFLICSEMFAVGRSTVSIMLREVVHALNVALRNEISWPRGDDVRVVAQEFQELCGLPGVCGAMDGTQIAITKPRVGASDYFYFKSGGYSMNCQAVVDTSKRFMDLYVGMPGSTNDSRMLRRSTLFHRAQHRTLWDSELSFNGFSPYLLADAGYPLMPWLMVPHRRETGLSVSDRYFNRRLSRGQAVVENAFGILKLSFRELHGTCNLDVKIVPDVVTCCALLHNALQNQGHEEVDRLLHIVREQDLQRRGEGSSVGNHVQGDEEPEDPDADNAQHKRTDLGAFLTLQRIVPL